MASLCQIRKVSAQVCFSEPGKLDGPFIKCCSLLWTERACHQMLLHAKFPPRSKTVPPFLQTWHPRSVPSARKLSPDRANIRLQQAGPPNKTKRVFGAQKRGQAFLPDFNCWANWWTQFWVQISAPEMGPQYVKKKALASCLRMSGLRRGPWRKVLRRVPQRARHRFAQWLTECLLGIALSSLEPSRSCFH